MRWSIKFMRKERQTQERKREEREREIERVDEK
jgi:hypothetical protein